jgi:hypothetical protein
VVGYHNYNKADGLFHRKTKVKWLRLKSKIKAIFNGLGSGGFVAAKHP